MTSEPEKQPELDGTQLTKLAIEMGPLLAFLAAWLLAGINWATGVIMVASVVAMVASRALLGRIAPALVATAVLSVGFGSLTLLLDDPRFIQLKPTMVYLLFAAVLGIGVLVRKPLLQLLLGEALKLTDEGWRLMSIRWSGFFVSMAIVNEIVRQGFSEGTWVTFKVAGFPILTIAFVLAQTRLIQRHQKT